jgi:fused signal recognition particle receptor
MFDFLKKKIGGFIDGLTKKEAEKPPEELKPVPEIERAEEAAPQIIEEEAVPEIEEKPEARKAPEKKEAPKPPAPKEAPKPKKAAPTPQPAKKKEPAVAPPKPEARKEVPAAPAPKAPAPQIPKPPEAKPAPPPPVAKKEIPKPPVAAPPEEKKRIKLGAVSAIKSFITSEVEIKEGDVGEMLDGLELELLESDVDISVAESITEELRGKLIGARTARSGLHAFVGGAIRDTLTDVITNDKAFDLVERVDACEKPAKIMFLGINGAGKTTTIAKVARLLMDNDRKVVFAAADTFRAAAIEQVSVHADRLGVKVIKRDYGSDPTSVAYDAVNYARAHGIDAVLIDTAGRQDTNISLLNEMKKMTRVISPDLKIYIGESIAGNAIIEQISAFNREIGIDAVILTKMDCDPKGGTMLSINRATGIPIIYVGVGQAYSDLEKFDPARIVGRIVE